MLEKAIMVLKILSGTNEMVSIPFSTKKDANSGKSLGPCQQIRNVLTNNIYINKLL